MRAGLEKILVRRQVGEKTTAGGIVVPEGVGETSKVGTVVSGVIENLGPRCKSGMSFGGGVAYYDVRAATVVEKGSGYVLEILGEEDILAFAQAGQPKAAEVDEPDRELEETMEGPEVEE